MLKAHTVPWEPPKSGGIPPLFIGLGLLAVVVGGVAAYLAFRVKKTKEADHQAASILRVIKRARGTLPRGGLRRRHQGIQELHRSARWRSEKPDVYRRLTVCYQNTNEIKEASRSWEKMRSLGGLKNLDDYALGVELMSAQGREAEAAEIYEQSSSTKTMRTSAARYIRSFSRFIAASRMAAESWTTRQNSSSWHGGHADHTGHHPLSHC